MIIITKKVHRGRLAAGCLVLVLAIGVVGAGLGLVRDIRETQAVSVVHQGTKGVRSNETRIAFLEGFGWVVGPAAGEPGVPAEGLRREEGQTLYLRSVQLSRAPGGDLGQHPGLPQGSHRRGGILQSG